MSHDALAAWFKLHASRSGIDDSGMRLLRRHLSR